MEDALWRVSTEQDVKLASERAGYMYVECGAWQMGKHCRAWQTAE